MTEAGEPDVKPALRLLQFITGHWVAAAVYAAARLKLADLLEGGPKASDEFADAVGAHKSAVYRLLRTLATLGIFEEIAPKQFKLTELGDLLRLQSSGINATHGPLSGARHIGRDGALFFTASRPESPPSSTFTGWDFSNTAKLTRSLQWHSTEP